MSQKELEEHRRYLADERKVAAYRAALAEVVRPGDVVVDLGAGTGLLGYLACEAGAAEIIAIDGGDILSLARRVAADNGYGKRIRHVQALSTEVTLTEPADVIVCDQIGGLVHDAGLLHCYADARQRLLKQGGRLVPESFQIFLAPVTFPRGRAAVDFWGDRPADIDVSAARHHASNTEWRYTVDPAEVSRLAPAAQGTSFASDHQDAIRASVDFLADTGGRLDGVLGWFDARMSPSVSLTNDPWSADRFDRWCNFYPLAEALDVSPGDTVHLKLDVLPGANVVNWEVVLRRQGEEEVRSRQSTFYGGFVSAASVAALSRDVVPAHQGRAGSVSTVLALLEDGRTTSEMAGALVEDGSMPSQDAARAFVARVLNLCR